MIPVNEPLLTEEDFQPLKEAFQTGWISSAGKYVEEFESQWAAYCGVKHGITVANGTVALEVAVEALGITKDDEVIMPSFTIISCAGAIVKVGAKPVLIDCDEKYFQMNVLEIESKITSKTKAIMVVHMYGHPTDMDPILELARKYNLNIIEDAAEVHGALYKSDRKSSQPVWKKCGGMGHIATFSFFANKLITTGEGGMLVTDDEKLAQKCKSLRNLCFIPERRFLHHELGHQFRMTNMQAAVGVNQVKRIEKIVERKRWIADQYKQRLSVLSHRIQLPQEADWARSVYWIYSLLLKKDDSLSAVDFAKKLKEEGVETRPFFLGMHEQPVFHKMGLFNGEKYPVSEYIAEKGLYIPSGLGITLEQIEIVSDKVKKVLS